MFEQVVKHADLPARAAMSAIFILSGLSKIDAYETTQGYMEAFGLPSVLLTPTIIFEIGAGLALLTGFATRYTALLLCVFSIATALLFHRNFADQIELIMFLKNVAITGGLLLLAKTGAPVLSLDQLLSNRREAVR